MKNKTKILFTLIFILSISARLVAGDEKAAIKELVRLNDKVASAYNKGRYKAGAEWAEKAYEYAKNNFGAKHPDTLNILNNLGFLYSSQGRYNEAEPLYKKALRLHNEVLGAKHPDTLTSLNNLGGLYKSQGRYSEAEPLFKETLRLKKEILGAKHPSTLTSLNNLGVLYESQGRYNETEPLYKEALRLREELLGAKHPDTIGSLNNLGFLYSSQGRYNEAEPLYKKALQLHNEVLGAKHPSTLTSLDNLGGLYSSLGRYNESEQLYKKALQLKKEVLGAKHPATIISMNSLGGLYLSLGRYSEAEPLYKKALKLRKDVLGAKHPATMISMNSLGGLYSSQGRYSEAEPLNKEALRLCQEVLGVKHPSTLVSMNNLGGLYTSQGRYNEAEPLYKEALRLREEVLGMKHPSTLASMNNLGGLYSSLGRYSEAEPLYKRVLQVYQEALGAKHPDTLTSLNNLGLLYTLQERYSEAEPLYKEALRLSEEVLGTKHPSILTRMNNLGGLYESQARYNEAEPLYKRTLQVCQEVLGAKHPDTLTSLNNLGELYRSQGRYSEAVTLNKKTLRLREEVVGAKHPDTLTSMNNLGALYCAQGKHFEAELLFKEALPLLEEVLGASHPNTINVMQNYVVCLINQKKNKKSLQLLQKIEKRLFVRSGYQLYSIQKDRVKRKFLYSKSNFQNIVFSFAGLYKSRDLSRFTANVALRWKQIQKEEQAFIARLAQTSNDPQIKELITKISSLRSILPRSFQDKNSEGMRAPEKILEDLELAELELAGLSREYKENLEVYGADVNRVRAGLPTSGALIEFRIYYKADFKKGELGSLHVAASLILADNDEVYFEDLGTMDLLLKSFLAENQFKALYKFLMGRFDGKIKNIKTLYIAPDGVLNLEPFDRLITPDGRYLVERQEVRVVQTGRDILRPKQKSDSKKMIALGGVEYDKFSDKIGSKSQKVSKPESINNARLMEEMDDFEYLPASRYEMNKIVLYYKRSRKAPAEELLGFDASEAALKGLKTGPKILHLSTHGYYLKNNELEKERPMLLSGLALAGANQGRKGFTGPGGEDGILYAMEILGLNLKGTELVSLSACATGSGVLDYSEGVYGLVRAFRIAGVQSALMTLSPVGDKDARDFMVAFYKNWMEQKDGTHPATALRKTKLDFINHKEARYKNPGFWSPYVLVGR